MTGQYRTGLDNLTPDERRQVEEMARDIRDGSGVATIDLPSGSKNSGKRHRLRRPLEQMLGFKIEYGVDRDWDTGRPFAYFARAEQISPEQQAARQRLGFA